MKEQAKEREWLPLSFAQHAIWLESKLNPQSVLQLGGWARVEGEIDVALARQAVSLVMARHDALRLRVDDAEPRQWMDSSCAAPLSVVRLPSAGNPDDEFQIYLERVFRSPLPFGDDALFHISLIPYSPELSYMLWRFHHIIADSVSTTTAMRYWTEAYLALLSDEPAELSPRTSYRSRIDADAEYLRSQEYQRDLSYWVDRFTPLPPVLVDGASLMQRGAVARPFHGDFSIEENRWRDLQQLAEEFRVGPVRLIFSLFALAVADRYQEMDIVLGVALHRRDRSMRYALGMFSGVIPVRFCFDPSESLSKVAFGFSEQIDRDLRYQKMPVDDLARALGLFRTGRSRLFDVVLSYIPLEEVAHGPLSEGLAVASEVVAFPEASPVSLHVTETEGGVKIRVAVNPHILNGHEAETLALLLQVALERVGCEATVSAKNLFSKNKGEHAIVVEESSPEREEWII